MKILLVAAALMLAGCSTSPPGGDDYTVPPMEDGKYVIKMTSDLKFEPEKAKVPVGATVLWKHTGASHNVNPEDNAWPASKVGEDFELEITSALIGDHTYVCDPHASLDMKGTLRVVESL